jgi:hypothetical protein
MLLLAAAVRLAAGTTNDLAEAKAEGCALARQLCELRPAENFTNASTLIIRPGKGRRREFPLRTVTTLTETNWMAVYETLPGTNATECQRLIVTHHGLAPNGYALSTLQTNGGMALRDLPAPALAMMPFANSDFWVVDLGLEFLHWPAQKLLKKELKKGQSCAVLESQNPEPATNTYSRVVSWIDIDTGGIVLAEAFDARGKLLKEFELKEAEKVNGQWKVSELQMRNAQTGSRTMLKFNFKQP